MNQAEDRQTLHLADAPKAGASEDANLDKVRDILFGSQMRDYEKRFARLEDRLLKESTDVREDVRRRLEALEQFTRTELESLTDRLKAEQQARLDAVEEVSRELRDAVKAVDKRLGQLDEQTTRGQRELRQQILDQSKHLSDEIQQKHDDLSARLEREVQELRADKTDRATLATLLTEMALRLTNEFKIPGND